MQGDRKDERETETVKTYIMMARADPFGPPIGSITPPSSAAAGSVVRRPSLSSAQSSGMAPPRRRAL